MSLPFFDRISHVALITCKNRGDHGWQVFIAHDPMAGLKNRYSVIKINCQSGYTTCHAREVSIAQAHKIRDEIVSELVRE